MKLIALSILVYSLVIPVFALEWFTNQSNGHQYAELDWSIYHYYMWIGAEQMSVDLGGHLVTINDADENDWVRSTFNLNSGPDQMCWIGLSEVLPYNPNNRQWAWSSGETTSYFNWGDGEPSGSAEHWVAMDGDGWWRDAAGDNPGPPFYRQTAVVEVVPEPSSLFALAGGIVPLGVILRKRRKK